jgi:hypothetical protein
MENVNPAAAGPLVESDRCPCQAKQSSRSVKDAMTVVERSLSSIGDANSWISDTEHRTQDTVSGKIDGR